MTARRAEPSAPSELETGDFAGALLIGSKDEAAAYWYVPANQIVFVTDAETASPRVAETYRLSQETVGEHVLETERDGSVWSLTRLGEFLRNVSSFRDVRILTVRQEEAYALCRVSGLERTHAAALLGLSERILADHLSTAQKKITCAFNLIEALND